MYIINSSDIDLNDVFVPENNKLAKSHDFNSTNLILGKSRLTVMFLAAGCSSGAYEAALNYTLKRK